MLKQADVLDSDEFPSQYLQMIHEFTEITYHKIKKNVEDLIYFLLTLTKGSDKHYLWGSIDEEI